MKFQLKISSIGVISLLLLLWTAVSSSSQDDEKFSKEMTTREESSRRLAEMAFFTEAQLRLLRSCCKTENKVSRDTIKKLKLPMKVSEFVVLFGFPDSVIQIQNLQIFDSVEIIWVYGKYNIFLRLGDDGVLRMLRVGVKSDGVIKMVETDSDN
jgi:hypothetical protein